MNEWIVSFRAALETLDRLGAESVVNQALMHLSPIQVIDQVVVPTVEQIGLAWEKGDIALSQVYMSGRICEELVEQVLPPSDPDRKHQPRSAIVVLSDYHMLGKRIVYSQMRASGFELFDYGRTDVDELVERALADNIRVLLISVLMLPSALKVGQVCTRLKAAGLPVKVVVGEAPFLFDDKLWNLLPPSVDDWLNQDHLARFIVEVIDQLDLSKLTRQYAGRGSKAYHPATLLAILVYGYATGVFSSRRLQQATYDSVAFRFLAANRHPDHDSLAAFRRRFLDELNDLFLQVLEMAKEMKVLKVGNICLDGTKIEANASRHSALSHG